MAAETEAVSADAKELHTAEECKQAGNSALAKGDHAEACLHYDKGLASLPPGTGSDLRLALCLNASLAHLKRGNLASAVEHATGALAIDPQNVKALYRRGMAKKRLSSDPEFAHEIGLAQADLECVLALDPSNAEVRDIVKKMRSDARAGEQQAVKSQREDYKKMFNSGKSIYKETPVSKPEPVISDTDTEGHELRVSVENVDFLYVRGEPVLDDVSLNLREGHCIGVFGNNATGKTTLARLLGSQISPSSGRIVHHGKAVRAGRASASTALMATAVMTVFVAVAVAALPPQYVSVLWRWLGPCLATFALCSLAFFGVIKLMLDRRKVESTKHSVVHISSDTSDKEEIKPKTSLEKMIGDRMPIGLKPDEKRAKIVAMLAAGGFQMYNQETGEPIGSPEEYIRDGLQYGNLSGGQRHLIYTLRCLASNPDVLLCDEVLGGLDAFRQPRVLHMISRLKKERGTSVLYITTELHQLHVMADAIAYMSDGTVSEYGPRDQVLEFPKHPGTKAYVSDYRTLPGCQVIGGKLAQNYAELKGDAALAGPWLP